MPELNVGVPLFATAKGIKGLMGVPGPRLTELVSAGAVKSIKFGASKQAGRLYSTRDVECALERMAVGKKPKKMAQAMTEGMTVLAEAVKHVN